MSSDLAHRIQEDHLTCQICFSVYIKPKALPCLHTFCESCLRDYIVSRSFEQVGLFPCPICRAEISVPVNGVEDFPDNHLLASLSYTLTTPAAAKTGNEVPNATPWAGWGNSGQQQVAVSEQNETARRRSQSDISTVLYPIDFLLVDNPISENTRSHSHTNIGSVDPDPTFPMHINNQIKSHSSDQQIYRPPRPPLPVIKIERSNSNTSSTSTDSIQNHAIIPCSHGMIRRFGKYGPTLNDFHRPKGLAVSVNGEIIVSDLGGNRIFIFSEYGELKSKIVCDCIVHDIAVTPRGGIMAATNKTESSEIMREYTFGGKVIGKFGSFFRYENPSGMAVSKDNYVVVTGIENHMVYVFSPQRKLAHKFGSRGGRNECLQMPFHCTVDSRGRIIVADSGNHCVKIFKPDGRFKLKIGTEGSGPGQFKTPLGVCTDKEDNIFVADYGNNRVQAFNCDGKYLATPVKATYKIQADVTPTNVAFSSNNTLIVLLCGPSFAEVRVYIGRPQSSISTKEQPDSPSCCVS